MRGLSRCGITINSSSGNATGQVVERVVRERERRFRADLERGRKSETCVDTDKFVAKYRNIGTFLVSINVVRIYCRVVNSIYIVIASGTTHSSKSIEFVWLLCIHLKRYRIFLNFLSFNLLSLKAFWQYFMIINYYYKITFIRKIICFVYDLMLTCILF